MVFQNDGVSPFAELRRKLLGIGPWRTSGVPTLSEEETEAFTARVNELLGPSDGVFHENASEHMHLDVIPVPPSEKVPAWKYVTMGLSAVEMPVPPEARGECPTRMELMVVLPPDWPDLGELMAVGSARRVPGAVVWMIDQLKLLARFAFDVGTWIGPGHTVQSCESMVLPAVPADRSVKSDTPGAEFVRVGIPFVGWMVIENELVAEEERGKPVVVFGEGEGNEKRVHLLMAVPLFASELEHAREHGTESLLERFRGSDRMGAMGWADPRRKPVV